MFADLCHHGECINSIGSFHCDCQAGYTPDATATACMGEPSPTPTHPVHLVQLYFCKNPVAPISMGTTHFVPLGFCAQNDHTSKEPKKQTRSKDSLAFLFESHFLLLVPPVISYILRFFFSYTMYQVFLQIMGYKLQSEGQVVSKVLLAHSHPCLCVYLPSVTTFLMGRLCQLVVITTVQQTILVCFSVAVIKHHASTCRRNSLFRLTLQRNEGLWHDWETWQ